MNYKSELETAINAVEKASALCNTVQASLVSEESMQKKDKSPVTVADFGAQAIVIHELKKAFPNDPIVAEEDAKGLKGDPLFERIVNHLETHLPGLSEEDIITTINMGGHEGGKEGRFWTLDPIDGTKGFLRKEQYAVALALIEDGEVVLGVLGCPNLSVDSYDSDQNRGTLLYAVKGQGAFMKPINGSDEFSVSVSDVSLTSEANFCESVESGHSSHDNSAKIAEILNVTSEPTRIDSQCKYGVLSRGEASIYLRLPTRKDYEEKIWDHAAGYIVVKEAGGEVTDCMGNELDFSLGRTLKNNTGIVGTNGRIHDEVIEAVNEVLS